MTPGSAEVDAKRRLLQLLDAAGDRSAELRFWWRDDDARAATPQLVRLLDLATRFDLPLGLAVVPAEVAPELADRVECVAQLYVLQHGWNHRNHSPPGEKKMELGDHRPSEAIEGELRLGFERLRRLFPGKFLPVLVPPWNRMGDAAKAAMPSIGLRGLSTFGPADPAAIHQANVHLDLFAWRPARRPLSPSEIYAGLCREVSRRSDGAAEPIGIMTHHLVHGEESWSVLEEVFALLRDHPAAAWPSIPALFDVAPEPTRA
jgi:hypothetical protein